MGKKVARHQVKIVSASQAQYLHWISLFFSFPPPQGTMWLCNCVHDFIKELQNAIQKSRILSIIRYMWNSTDLQGSVRNWRCSKTSHSTGWGYRVWRLSLWHCALWQVENHPLNNVFSKARRKNINFLSVNMLKADVICDNSKWVVEATVQSQYSWLITTVQSQYSLLITTVKSQNSWLITGVHSQYSWLITTIQSQYSWLITEVHSQ